MSVLFVGDVHIKPENTKSVDVLIGELVRLCVEQQPTIVLLSGDILHTHERLHTTALNKAYELIRALLEATVYTSEISETHGTVVILVGNHDYENNQQFMTDRHWMNGLKRWERVVIIDRSQWITPYFIAVPYVPPGRFVEALDGCMGVNDWNQSKCIFAHQEFRKCKMGAIESVVGDEWPLDAPMIISGHIHDTQRPQSNIYYPGASLQQAYGERCGTHCVLVSVQKGDKFSNTSNESYGLHLRDLPIIVPRKTTLQVESLDDLSVTQILNVDPQNLNQTRVCLFGSSVAEFKTIKKSKPYKDLIDQGVKIVFRPNLQSNPETNGSKKTCRTPSEQLGFEEIVRSLVISKNSPALEKMYLRVIENRVIL